MRALAAAAAALALLACGDDAKGTAGTAPAKGAGGASPAVETRLEAATTAVLKAVDADDAEGFAKVSADVRATAVRRLAAADVRALVDDLHGKYGQRKHRTLDGGEPALPGWPGRVRSVLVAFGDDEDLIRLWFVEDGGDLLLARVSDEDAASLSPPPPK